MRILLAGLLFAAHFCVSRAQEITSLTLIDSGTNEPVIELADGEVIDIRALGYEELSFNIEALTSPDSVGSVRFDFDGIADYRTENKAPYSFCGDKGGIFSICNALNEGYHTITATAFSGSGASGTFGSSLEISFTLMLGSPVPVAFPVETPGPIETPAASPVTDFPVVSPITESPVANSITETPSSSPITEAPAASPITESPSASPITEAPAASPITETPSASPITEAPATGAVSNSDIITALYLIYAPTNERVMELYDGAIVSLTDLNLTDASFNVEAVATDDVMSVFFQETSRSENKRPFSFCGDKSGDFATCVIEFFVGSSNSVTVTPYTGPSRSGTALPDVSVSFSIQSEPATSRPSDVPSDAPTDSLNAIPTNVPSDTPSEVPSPAPTRMLANLPTGAPLDATTFGPSDAPSDAPSAAPSFPPSSAQTNVPSALPDALSSDLPSNVPSELPNGVNVPSDSPFATPTSVPSDEPSDLPSQLPSELPIASLNTDKPSDTPSDVPSAVPNMHSGLPSDAPSNEPSMIPTDFQSDMPSDIPSALPYSLPTTIIPSDVPSDMPSSFVSNVKPSALPSDIPSNTPSLLPSYAITDKPSDTPSDVPSAVPYVHSGVPSDAPSNEPSMIPTDFQSDMPSDVPSDMPSSFVSNVKPSALPSDIPSNTPSLLPSYPITDKPSDTPSDVPSAVPYNVPLEAPSMLPTDLVSDIPSDIPSTMPYFVSTTPSDVPSNFLSTVLPTTLPSDFPSDAPSELPSYAIDDIPSVVPSAMPSNWTSEMPSDVPSNLLAPSETPSDVPSEPPVTIPFDDLLINCGGPLYQEKAGVRTWKEDQYFEGGKTFNGGSKEIADTQDDFVYRTERTGVFQYEVPVPPGDYEIKLHFAEIFFTEPNKRVFDLYVEGDIYKALDLIVIGGGIGDKAFTLEVAKVVDDGFVSIQTVSIKNNPKLSGIEIIQKEVHTAHAVAQGPYVVVDKDADGFGVIAVDASPSHTHGIGMVLTDFIWKEGAKVIGTGEEIELTLPVGEHTIALTVIDSGGNDSTEVTTMTVLPYGYPDIESLSPNSGSISGGYEVTIRGSGFTNSSDIIVHFGLTDLMGEDIVVEDSETIKLIAPFESVAVPVQVNVESIPLGAISNSVTFTFETAIPIAWTEKLIADFASVAVAAWGPDKKLYAGTTQGHIAKITLDNDYSLLDAVVSFVAPDRAILGMAFDPLTTADEIDPPVYFSSADLFHKDPNSSSGKAVNGKIQRASGANLDIIEDIISGLPVSDHDHAINGIEFGDHGELYMQIGSNTNGGLPGQLTGSQLQKENYFSAATVVAYLADPNFEPSIQYDAPDDGLPTTHGVEVFAPGLRNPFGICLHSNGYLYGTDNGPNLGYGDMMTGCGEGDFIPDVETEDRIQVILEDHYYGHPNPIRSEADNDTRQCKYRFPEEPSDEEYTAPIVIAPSSTGAVIEFQSDHFGGQMRGNLIYSKYTSKLYRVILRPDGLGVIAQSDPPLGLVGAKGLGVTQAPDGSLVQVQYSVNQLWVYIPDEADTTEVKVNSVFPRRGRLMGDSTLTVYGNNFQQSGIATTVSVGGSDCPMLSMTTTQITCTLPSGSGTVDVTVSVGGEAYTFHRGYRYIAASERTSMKEQSTYGVL